MSGRGRLYRRSVDGPWWCWYYDTSGARIRCSTHQLDREAARNILRDRERTASAPARLSPHRKTVGQAVHHLSTASTSHDWAPGTRKMISVKGGHVTRLVGGVELGALVTSDVSGYVEARLAEKAARETVRKELSVLRSALTEAIAQGWAPEGAKAALPVFRVRYEPRDTYLTEEGVRRLLGVLEPHRALWLLVAIYTGARRSEVESLVWEDVDLVTGRALLRGTKTKRSRRHLPIPDPLLVVLRAVDRDDRHGPVVTPWSNTVRDLRIACEHAKVIRVTPNDLRRTYATWLKARGVDSAVVARLLGHSSTRMVDLVYGQLGDDTLASAVALLDGTCANYVPDTVPPKVTPETGDTAEPVRKQQRHPR